jgi:hypothetical protein
LTFNGLEDAVSKHRTMRRESASDWPAGNPLEPSRRPMVRASAEDKDIMIEPRSEETFPAESLRV